MKGTVLLSLLCVVLLTACGAEDVILDDMFGWAPGYQRSSTSQSGQQPAASAADDQQANTVKTVDMDSFCAQMPHSHYDGKGCVCDDGFKSEMGVCVQTSGSATTTKECIFDQDCSPSGADKAVCSGTQYSLRYRCDLRTNTCIPRKGSYAAKVDCVAEFGAGYVCKGGLCVKG